MAQGDEHTTPLCASAMCPLLTRHWVGGFSLLHRWINAPWLPAMSSLNAALAVFAYGLVLQLLVPQVRYPSVLCGCVRE